MINICVWPKQEHNNDSNDENKVHSQDKQENISHSDL